MEYNKAYFKGMTAAVTGGASGIGLALCEELLDSGAERVVLADFNRENLALHEKRLSERYPERVKGVYCNVTVESDVQRMIDEAAAFGGGKLDLLINCAGAAFMGKFAWEPNGVIPDDPFQGKIATNEDWQKAFALNFYGALYGCRAALPYMLEQRGGQIVNIISGIAFSPMAFQSMYAATKCALAALSFALRYEYRDYGVKVNTATPGTTATAIFPGDAPPEAQTPHQSAQRILHGVANDERIILGDDSDAEGSQNCFLPDGGGEVMDNVYNSFASIRKSGTLTFASADFSKPTPAQEKQIQEILGVLHAPTKKVVRLIDDYAAKRKPLELDRRYYEGKTAAVTGGASGVGLAMVEKLLECGARKIALADCNREQLMAHAARLNASYPDKVKAIYVDVADETSVRSMIAEAHAFFDGSFDILVNCAGIGSRGLFAATPDLDEITKRTRMEVEPPEAWERVFGVNFYGALYGCRAALPIMVAQKSGQIVNVISGEVFTPLPYEAVYAASKAALNGLTLVLRYEYWDSGVKFNSATPGTTATAIFGTEVPERAQSPERSATRVLTGVARNERVICGDDNDFLGSLLAFNARMSGLLDDYGMKVARERRSGQGSAC